MDRKDPISDATISRNVTRQLSSCGLRSPCRIQVQTRNGEVTLSGNVQFVHQRNAAVQSIRTVEGVRRIVEKLKVTPPAKHQYPEPAARPAKQPAAEQPEVTSDAAVDEQSPPAAPNASEPMPRPEAATVPVALESDEESVDFSFTVGNGSSADRMSPVVDTSELHHTRSGDNYTFDCASEGDAERLRDLLANYADWLKKNSWIGKSKPSGKLHRVTFHAKSVIDFLRQEGF